jgi:hypothetical protein
LPAFAPGGPAGSALDPRSVFLNGPYDKQYAPLFIALIAGLVALGRAPRCALEAQSDGRARNEQIYRLLAGCGSSISDLSRVTLSGKFRVPRFNMPFELGIAFALAQGNGHRIFVFEEQRRLQATLSDMNGFDAFIHGGTQEGVLYRILDCFARPRETPRFTDLKSLTERLSRVAAKAQSEQSLEDPFKPYIFNRLVESALELAQKKGLIA